MVQLSLSQPPTRGDNQKCLQTHFILYEGSLDCLTSLELIPRQAFLGELYHVTASPTIPEQGPRGPNGI